MAYCINCGVELAASEKECPLCRTPVIHPTVKSGNGELLFPKAMRSGEKVSNRGLLFILTIICLCPAAVVILCDYKITGSISWSGIVTASLLLGYTMIVLPLWFRKPNPVVFVPVDFAAIALFLLYLNYNVGGSWFLSLAFPITGAICIIVTTVITLIKYVKKGYLYIIGSAIIAIGALTMLIELMINVTFDISKYYFWSAISFTPCFIIGMSLIVVAICKPLKESLKKKFFI